MAGQLRLIKVNKKNDIILKIYKKKNKIMMT